MTVRFTVPANWRSITELPALGCDAQTVGAALSWFAGRYPALRERFLTDDGDIAPWALVSLDQVDVRTLADLTTPISAGDHEIEILAALMGG